MYAQLGRGEKDVRVCEETECDRGREARISGYPIFRRGVTIYGSDGDNIFLHLFPSPPMSQIEGIRRVPRRISQLRKSNIKRSNYTSTVTRTQTFTPPFSYQQSACLPIPETPSS